MENYKTNNLITSWFLWHFFEAPKFLFSVWKNYIFFVLNYFSVSLLLSTFFSPWRKYRWQYPRGFDFGKYYEVFISNIFSRIIGAFLRLILIIIGIIAQILVIIAGIVVILFWILMPFIALALIFFLFYAPLEVWI